MSSTNDHSGESYLRNVSPFHGNFGDGFESAESRSNETRSTSPSPPNTGESSLDVFELRAATDELRRDFAELKQQFAELQRQFVALRASAAAPVAPPSPPRAVVPPPPPPMPTPFDPVAVFARDPADQSKKVCLLCEVRAGHARPEARDEHVKNKKHLKLVLDEAGKPKYYCKGECGMQIPRLPRPMPVCLQQEPANKECEERERSHEPAGGHIWCCKCGGAFVLEPTAAVHTKKKARIDVARSSTSLAGSQVSTTPHSRTEGGGDEADS